MKVFLVVFVAAQCHPWGIETIFVKDLVVKDLAKKKLYSKKVRMFLHLQKHFGNCLVEIEIVGTCKFPIVPHGNNGPLRVKNPTSSQAKFV